jgi:hypothetical protein
MFRISSKENMQTYKSEVIRMWRKLHNKEIQNLHSSCNTVTAIKIKMEETGRNVA